MKLYFSLPEGSEIYAVDSGKRFTQTDKDGNRNIILENVSDVFDGLADRNLSKHFAIQTTDGSLLYLRHQNNEWKKYELLRSKSKVSTIKNIILAEGANLMCAFYCMEHNGKNLLICHRFSSSEPHLTPDVVDILDIRADFCVWASEEGCILSYRDLSGRRLARAYDPYFRHLPHPLHLPDEDIFSLRSASSDSLSYHAYTTARKGYTAIMFWDPKSDFPKVITFGVARNCIPFISIIQGRIFIQWEENGFIMQSESLDNGNTFSSPSAKGKNYEFMRWRSLVPGGQYGMDVWAINKDESYAISRDMNYNHKERNNKMNSANIYRNFENTDFFKKKLSEIENDVALIGRNLEKMCTFLERLTEFKKETSEDTYTKPFVNMPNEKTDALSGNDIGEIDADNIRLFEAMNPDDDSVVSKEFIQE